MIKLVFLFCDVCIEARQSAYCIALVVNQRSRTRSVIAAMVQPSFSGNDNRIAMLMGGKTQGRQRIEDLARLESTQAHRSSLESDPRAVPAIGRLSGTLNFGSPPHPAKPIESLSSPLPVGGYAA